jgi:competence protein ComEC
MLVITVMLLIDTLGLANMPLTLSESVAASLVKDRKDITVYGTVYRQEEKNEQFVLYLNQTYLFQDSQKVKANDIIIYQDISKKIPIGYQIKVRGTARKFAKAANPGQFNAYLYYKSLNIDFSVQADSIQVINRKTNAFMDGLFRLSNHLSHNFDSITKDEVENGTFKAMVLGDKSEFSGSIKDLYQKGGILHAFCVSGSHIAIIGMFAFSLFRKIGGGYRTSCLAGIGIVICYGVMTGFGVSAVRAVIMYIIGMIASMLGRTYDLMSSLALAAILVLLDNPLYIINIAFLLSFGAIIGMGVVAPILSNMVGTEVKLVKIFLESLGVTIVTFPIIVYTNYEFPIYSILINLIIIPIMSYVLISGILGCICAEFSLLVGSFMLGTGSYILKLYEMVCELSLRLPYSSVIIGKPSWIQIVLYYIILLFTLIILKNSKKRRYALLFLLMFLAMVYPRGNQFFVTFLDVGQGDGIVIHSEKGTSFMIDGGSSDVKNVGKYRILPFLKSQGIRKLDYCILTHPDEDHKSGLEEVILSGYKIENLIMPEIEVEDDAYLALVQLAKKAGIHVIYLGKGERLVEDELVLSCFHPYKDYIPESRNDYSTVIGLSFEGLDMLLTGDIEAKGEKELCESLNQDYDILKVAHHGSKNSTSEEFLKRVNAEFAVISCGANNRYGHPHKELLQRLKEREMKPLVTKDMGAITIYIEEGVLSYEGYKE